jgi:hypothetical protein
MLQVYYKQENDMDGELLRRIQKAFLAKIDGLKPKYGANEKLPYRLNAILKTHFNDMEDILEKRTNSLEDKLILKIIMYERIAATLGEIDRYEQAT